MDTNERTDGAKRLKVDKRVRHEMYCVVSTNDLFQRQLDDVNSDTFHDMMGMGCKDQLRSWDCCWKGREDIKRISMFSKCIQSTILFLLLFRVTSLPVIDIPV